MKEDIEKIISALKTLDVTADRLFEMIKEEDLERGLEKDARARLDFVDMLVTADEDKKRICPGCGLAVSGPCWSCVGDGGLRR